MAMLMMIPNQIDWSFGRWGSQGGHFSILSGKPSWMAWLSDDTYKYEGLDRSLHISRKLAVGALARDKRTENFALSCDSSAKSLKSENR